MSKGTKVLNQRDNRRKRRSAGDRSLRSRTPWRRSMALLHATGSSEPGRPCWPSVQGTDRHRRYREGASHRTAERFSWTVRQGRGSVGGTPAAYVRQGQGFVSRGSRIRGCSPYVSGRRAWTLAALPPDRRSCPLRSERGGADLPRVERPGIRQVRPRPIAATDHKSWLASGDKAAGPKLGRCDIVRQSLRNITSSFTEYVAVWDKL